MLKRLLRLWLALRVVQITKVSLAKRQVLVLTQLSSWPFAKCPSSQEGTPLTVEVASTLVDRAGSPIDFQEVWRCRGEETGFLKTVEVN